MKIKKYGYALLMICLIGFTVLLSVKHEQKRRSEKMTLQAEETASQSEEETVYIESDATAEREESEREKEDETIEETILEILKSDKYFKIMEIMDAGERNYLYTIYNADGEAVKREKSYREPWIYYIDQETLEIGISAGTYAFYCVYYDIINDRFSEQYECPIAAKYHKVAFRDYKDEEEPLIIKDMFDEGNGYKKFTLDFADVIVPVEYAEFKDEDTLFIIYNSGDDHPEKAKLLFWGEGEGEEKEIPVCDIVRAMDFTAKKPQLGITPEENQIYLEGYLKVLKNEIPIVDETGEQYYKDLWKAGIEFEQLLKEKDTREYPYLYYYDDLDGDGKPEFAIEQGCMFLFKYEKELDICKLLYDEEACYFETIVGAGQIWRHDGLHADIVRDDYIGLGEDGNFQYILRLEEGINPNHPYFEVGVSDTAFHSVGVSEEEWNEITQPFFEMVENNAVPRKTLEEVFGDFLAENTK